MNAALTALSQAGVSIWLDDLSRARLQTGTLAELVAHDNVVGVTTNPTIFAKAITGSDDYDSQLHDLAVREASVGTALRELTTYDIRWGCDVLRPVYDATSGLDGRVSIEVDPRIAHDQAKTTAQAKMLHWLVDRPNVLIKIPATAEGLGSIEAATAAGISVNVTLIFALDRYDQVM